MNYSFASISADHLGYNVTIFDVSDDKLVRILSSENSQKLCYDDIVKAIPSTVDRTILSGNTELRSLIAKTKRITVRKPPVVDPSISLCTMADKLNSGKMQVASQYQREILSSLRSSKPEEIPHNIRSLINICDTWNLWCNYEMHRTPNYRVSWN